MYEEGHGLHPYLPSRENYLWQNREVKAQGNLEAIS